jgi:hypothetical protein
LPSNFIPTIKLRFEAIKRAYRLNRKRNLSYYYMEEMTEDE